MNNTITSPENEDNDSNKVEPHDPVEAGKKAIKAERLANDNGANKEQQEEEDKADAEKWRNEG